MGRPRGVNQAGASRLERSRSWGPECCGPPYPGVSLAGKSVHPGLEALAGKKTPLIAAYAGQGRGPDLAFGSRLGDERAWRCGLVIAPYWPVA